MGLQNVVGDALRWTVRESSLLPVSGILVRWLMVTAVLLCRLGGNPNDRAHGTAGSVCECAGVRVCAFGLGVAPCVCDERCEAAWSSVALR